MGSDAVLSDSATLGSSLKAFSWAERYLRWSAVWSQSMARWEEAVSANSSEEEQGRAQPRQKLCQGQREHQEPSF
jgi:hypothetical protein